LPEGWEPLLLISIVVFLLGRAVRVVSRLLMNAYFGRCRLSRFGGKVRLNL
jgi:hypothetical protein